MEYPVVEPAGDDGAAAVEFALVLPILLLLVFGIVDFGLAYQAKVELAHAAREGVRTYVLTQDATKAEARTREAAAMLDGSDITVTATGCAGTADFGDSATVTATYQFSYLTPLPSLVAALPGAGDLSSPITISEDGVMRCGG